MQTMCPEMREYLKKMEVMKTNDGNSQANMVQNIENEDLYLATTEEVVKSKRVRNFVATKHICRD